MKLIIVSGQEGTDVESLFEKVISETDMCINMLLKWYFQKILCFYDTQELYIIM